VAARIGAGCISGVNGVFEADGRICFQRDLHGGKLRGRFASHTATTVVTLQPGIFKFAPDSTRPAGRVTRKTADCRLARTRFLGTRQVEADTSNITEAPIVVAVGNGIGSQENLAMAYRLAHMLPKAVVAGTRILCDRGWLGYHQQVGVTGATVAPALYIALGISGAAQHVMGMRASGFVIAVNTDCRAPIFNEADIGVVEDIKGFVPLVLEAYERSQRNGR
jgi:electron transfer flavoprotein alpha subunit